MGVISNIKEKTRNKFLERAERLEKEYRDKEHSASEKELKILKKRIELSKKAASRPLHTLFTYSVIAFFGMVVVLVMVSSGASRNNQQVKEQPAVQTDSSNTTKNKAITSYSRMYDCERLLSKYLEGHDVNVKMSKYKEWESAKGVLECQGSFEFDKQDTLHTFHIRIGTTTNEVIRLEIDGERYFFDDEAQTRAMEAAEQQ